MPNILRDGPRREMLHNFDRADYCAAQREILHRGDWHEATVATVKVMEEAGFFSRPTLKPWLLDYGCGMGRIARRVMGLHHRPVLGVDSSPQMLKHSMDYVGGQGLPWVATSPLGLLSMKQWLRGGSIPGMLGGIYAIETFQHIPGEALDELIVELLDLCYPGHRTPFFVMGNRGLDLPREGAGVDEFLIHGVLSKHLDIISAGVAEEGFAAPRDWMLCEDPRPMPASWE